MEVGQRQMSAENRFAIAVTSVLCPLAFFAVWEWGAYGTLVVMLVPIAFMLRYPRGSLQNTDDQNTQRTDAGDWKPTGKT